MALTRITDHARRAILHLPPPYWGKPVIASCVWALCQEVQEAEDMLWGVMESRLVNNAGAAQLRVLGRLVGEPDVGLPLEEYRVLVRAKIRSNRSHGRAKDFTEVAGYLYDGKVSVADTGPALATVVYEDAAGQSFRSIRKITENTRAAGVLIELFIEAGADGLLFSDASGTIIPDPGNGTFADATDTIATVGELWSRQFLG